MKAKMNILVMQTIHTNTIQMVISFQHPMMVMGTAIYKYEYMLGQILSRVIIMKMVITSIWKISNSER
jgi:hypothetical protein